MTRKKILVITDHMPWGHRSIAKAIFSNLKKLEREKNWKVDYAEIKAETGPLGQMYNVAYKYFPVSPRLAFKLSYSKTLRRLTEDASVLNLPRLRRTVDHLKPDLIICSYFLHSHALAKWRKKESKQFKLWTVVADPWTINPVSFVKGADLNLVYDEVGENMAKDLGIEKDKVLATGWWTRGEMFQEYDKEKSKIKLGFKDNRPVVFIGGGSLGTHSLTKLLPTLLFVKKKIGVIVNTGTDKLLYNTVEEYARLFKQLRHDDLVQIKNMDWIENMAEVLSAADIVFGKAGPNFLFDVVATKRPFVSITHIGGQEDGNIDIIKRKKLGWVKEKGRSTAAFFLKFVNNPEAICCKYEESISQEADRNRMSMKKIVEYIDKRV